jgi:hypothetical protein
MFLPRGIDSLFGIRRAHNRFITALVSAVIGDRECCAPAWCKGASLCLRTPHPPRARSAASRCILYLSKQVDVNSVASTALHPTRYNRQRSQSHSREPYGRLGNTASSWRALSSGASRPCAGADRPAHDRPQIGPAPSGLPRVMQGPINGAGYGPVFLDEPLTRCLPERHSGIFVA